MGEKQRAGNGDEDRKNQPSAAGGDAARLHAPFKNSQRDYEQGEKPMQQDLGIRKRRPEPKGTKRQVSGSLRRKRNAERPKKASGQLRAQEICPACATRARRPMARTTMPAQ